MVRSDRQTFSQIALLAGLYGLCARCAAVALWRRRCASFHCGGELLGRSGQTFFLLV